MNKDLTVGKPETVLWKFSLPLFGSIIFQQLYNIADSLVAGKFIGENALAAVGNSYEITLIFIAFAFGCNIGCSVVCSRYFGAKEYHKVKTCVYTTFIASGILCLILMAAGFLLSPTLLKLIKTPDEIMSGSELYLNIYIGGLLFLFFYNTSTGIFSAMGDSKTPFIFLACSSITNIIVDIIFVKCFNMGIAGVAWATFICQGVSCVLVVFTLIKRLNAIETEGKIAIFSSTIFKQVTVIAVPSILQQSFISIGNIIIQREINGYGQSVIAGYSAAIKLNNLVVTSFTTLGNGMSNFVAQNLGAGKMDRIKKGYKGGLQMIYLICIPIVILYLLAGKQLVNIFMDKSTGKAIDTGVQFLRIVAPFYFIVATKLISDGVLRGATAMKLFMTTTFSDLILRVVLAIIMSDMFGATGIWCAWPVGWTIATAVSVVFYVKGYWKKIWINKIEEKDA